MPSRFDNNTVESRLARIENELELARVRDGRNIRHLAKVMLVLHAEVMAALLDSGPAADKKASLAFGKPTDKPSPASGGQAPVPPTPQKPWAPAGKPKEKTHD